MGANGHAVAGALAGALSLVSCLLYIVDIVLGQTRPSRTTWWVLALINAAIASSAAEAGAGDTIWLPASYAIGFGIVAILSLWKGEGSWTALDFSCLAGALVGLAVWRSLDAPKTALFLLIAVDALGLVPTVAKAFNQPWTEDRRAWILAGVASYLNCLAIEDWQPALVAYPLYVAIGNSAIVWLLLRPRAEAVA